MADCQRCENNGRQAARDTTGLRKTGGETIGANSPGPSVYTFYECEDCGAKWQHIKDSGVGGHSRTLTRLPASN